MTQRKEICRNFQRGSCQYGDRCKFLHATPQQSKTNPFGFGVQNGNPFQSNQQQQMSSPFGFNVQNSSQTRGGNGSGFNQFKPFENKWTRFSPANSNSASVSRQSDSQPQAANHKCTDPETCKRMMVEDFENEKPQWKLTCYGHNRNGPCDIVGDISCEELRALAYDDAKRGLSLHSIIDRERSLVNLKEVEFQNLIRKSVTVSTNTIHSMQNPFGGTSSNALDISSSISPPVSSFSQLNASLNTRSTATPNYSFGQASRPFQSNSQSSNMFQTSKLPFNSSETFGKQFHNQPAQSSSSFNSASSSNGTVNANRNPFSTLSNSSQMANVADSIMRNTSNMLNVASSVNGQFRMSIHDDFPEANANVDDSIWNKTEWKWNIGEIPEEEPPSNCIY